MLREVLEEADSQIPSYAQARGIYRGASETLEAIENGKNFLGKAPEIVSREVAELHPGQRDFYRLGAAQSLYEQVMRPADELTDVARRYFGGRLFGGRGNIDAQRLRALFPDAPEVADDFMRQVAAETRLSLTGQTIGRRGLGGRARQETVEAIEGAMPPHPRATPGLMAANVAFQAINRSRTGWTQDVSDELATLFAQGLDDPNMLQGLLNRLEATSYILRQRTAAGSRAATTLGQISGSTFR
jgi:hypothetical protein